MLWWLACSNPPTPMEAVDAVVDEIAGTVVDVPEIPPRVAALVDDPGVIDEDGVGGFRPVVLSNAAEGCVVRASVDEDGKACVAAVAKMAVDRRHRPKNL